MGGLEVIGGGDGGVAHIHEFYLQESQQVLTELSTVGGESNHFAICPEHSALFNKCKKQL